MQRSVWVAILVALALMAGMTSQAHADKKPVKATKEWSGSVADEALQKGAPGVIASAKDLEALWKSWKIDGKQPEVDFSKEMVVITTSAGTKLKLAAVLDDATGNLQVLGVGTRDLAPGFRYVIGTVSREGVKTVNGKKLP
jgi:hypothetical protein